MPTVKYELELDLPTLVPAELAKTCRENAKYYPSLGDPCPFCWFPGRCILDAERCSCVKAKDWKNFLKDCKVVEE